VAALSGASDRGPRGAPVRPPERELEALVRALALPGVANGRVRRVARLPEEGGGLEALARQVRRSLSDAERQRADGWARTALATIQRAGVHVLTPDMPEYPEPFRQLVTPPYAVFAVGRLELLETPVVAVVGTRSCTAYGLEAAFRIATGLSAAGVTVVSGLALGIDGAAHRGAGAARTIAVLGCGVDVAYPRPHRSLQRDIAREGLVLSELLPGAPPAAFHFPRRNRMIAALGLGLVVVEAPTKSGALLTATEALELGRFVFAVPGALDAPSSAGTNTLIQEGAVLVTGAREVIEALHLPVTVPDDLESDAPPADLYGVALALWRALGHGARHPDELAAELGLETGQSLASLLSLELQGHARQLPGMRFTRH
jgi:DNA processing protein